MQIGVDSQRAVENKRVFVIDSDDISSIALQFMLADDNETHVLASVDAALDKGRAWPPDLVLLGIANYLGEGSHCIERLRTHHPEVRILIVADPDHAAIAAGACSAGANAVLLRPLTLEAVRRKVDHQLGRRTKLAVPVVLSSYQSSPTGAA
jgi:DNA-binding NarL/FixJ family response regulator